MPLNRLIKFLDENGKKYVIVKHAPAFTTQEVAASAHIPGRDMVKSVMIKVDGSMKMVVIPTTHQLDVDSLKNALGAGEVRLASEDEFKNLFPDCELGAMPPFGHFYDIDTFAADVLTGNEKIAFNAGTHKELVSMSYRDYEELVKPQMLPDVAIKTV